MGMNHQSEKEVILQNSEKFSFSIYESIADCAEEWDGTCDENIYFSSAYLSLLEVNGPEAYGYYPVLIRQSNQAIGVLYCQRKTIDLSNDFRVHTHSESFIEKSKVFLTKWLFSRFKHEMLICGNVLLTGEYGFQFSKTPASHSELVDKVLNGVKEYISAQEGIKIKSTLVKDFHDDSAALKKSHFASEDYYGFKVQPDMVVPLKEEWGSYDDFLQAVKSKYRVKYKKVKKKGKDLDFKILNEEEVLDHNDAMFSLYKDTADRASFNLFTLDRNYFSELKKTLKQDLIITAVFLEDKLVAFFTLIKNGNIADAHFLGYDVKLNSKYQLYFNILLKLLEQALETKAEFLNLSRTAMEIKSSVAAVPYDLSVHFKYHNKFINRFVPYLFKRFVPEVDWLPRSPLK